MKCKPRRKPQSLSAILDRADPNGRGEERSLRLALAAADLALRAFRRGARVLAKLDASAFYDLNAAAQTGGQEPKGQIDGTVPADVGDSIETVGFFLGELQTATGIRPTREFVRALHARRPRFADGSSESSLAGMVLMEAVQRMLRRTWHVQAGLKWLQLATDSLQAYLGHLGDSTAPPAVCVAPICFERVAGFSSALIRSSFTGFDVGPFTQWAGVPCTPSAVVADTQDDDTAAPAPALAEAKPIRFREFL
jgi:hypothetical protein